MKTNGDFERILKDLLECNVELRECLDLRVFTLLHCFYIVIVCAGMLSPRANAFVFLKIVIR